MIKWDSDYECDDDDGYVNEKLRLPFLVKVTVFVVNPRQEWLVGVWIQHEKDEHCC